MFKDKSGMCRSRKQVYERMEKGTATHSKLGRGKFVLVTWRD